MRSITASVLPASFTPTEHHIIIGRGRVVKQHSANIKFDQMVQDIAAEYLAATNKADKGNILSCLVDQVHDAAPDAGFVKKDPATGRWIQVEESLARTTAAQALRNYLSNSYRSSKQFKSKRRMEQIQEESIRRTISSGAVSSLVTAMPSTRCVSPYSAADEAQSSPLSDFQTFALLESVFGQTVDLQDDAFSPRPIASSMSKCTSVPSQMTQQLQAAPVTPPPMRFSSVADRISMLRSSNMVLPAMATAAV